VQERLRLGIPEPAVELEYTWPVVREHDTGEEDADEGSSAGG
jgi:hypothetical protein